MAQHVRVDRKRHPRAFSEASYERVETVRSAFLGLPERRCIGPVVSELRALAKNAKQ